MFKATASLCKLAILLYFSLETPLQVGHPDFETSFFFSGLISDRDVVKFITKKAEYVFSLGNCDSGCIFLSSINSARRCAWIGLKQ